MLIGYARVSTSSQTTALQRDALIAAGVPPKQIHEDPATSGVKARPGLDRALAKLTPGNTLVVYSLSRLGRSTADLCSIVERVTQSGATLRSLTEAIDTSTPAGRLVLHIFASLAQFERELLHERAAAGRAAAKARGQHLGRPRALSANQLACAAKLVAGGEPVRTVAAGFGVNRVTLYRALRSA